MPIGAGAVIGIGASILGGVMGASSAKKAAQAAAREKARLQNKLSNLEKNRQDVVNPYEDFTNLSGMITNPFANLGVATGAALAQAALRSKKGVAASIEQQEKSNQDKAAAGEQRAQQQRMSEEQRMQQAGASGKQFVFGATEQREVKEMDRTYAEMMSAEQDRAQAEADKTGAVTGAIGSIASIGGGMLG